MHLHLLGALLSIGGTITVEVEEVGELEPPLALRMARAVVEAVEARTSSTVRLDDPIWWGCARYGTGRCAEELPPLAETDELVSLRLLGGVRTVRVLARRFGSGSKTPMTSASVDVVRTSSGATALEELAVALFPIGPAPRTTNVSASSPGTQPNLLPLPLLAGAGVAWAVAGALAASSLAARAELSSGPQSFVDYERLSDRFEIHRNLSITLFVTGGLAAIVAGVLWLVDGDLDVASEGVDGPREPAAFVFR